jgi:peptide/nickel transport system ATP-binding protein
MPETGASLEVVDLTVDLGNPANPKRVVDRVSFTLGVGETLGLVGESGSGKSMTAHTIMGLLRRLPVVAVSGSVRLDGKELIGLPRETLRHIRGNNISMIMQDPMSSLNPVFTIGDQIVQTIRAHQNLSKSAARSRAIELLQLAEIPAAVRRIDSYSHEFSGGMRQRAMLAVALANEPKVLIADEPTTALDVTVQAQILDLLSRLQKQLGMSMLFITHDLAVVAELCHRVAVMYAAQIVETALVQQLFARLMHPYTERLLQSSPEFLGPNATAQPPARQEVVTLASTSGTGCRFSPKCGYAQRGICDAEIPLLPAGPGSEHSVRCVRADVLELQSASALLANASTFATAAATAASAVEPLLDVAEVSVTYEARRRVNRRRLHVHAVSGVSLRIFPGETVALVGESGSGKSTLAKAICGLAPYQGKIRIAGHDLGDIGGRRAALLRQIIFQDPYSSLNPTMTVVDVIAEPLRLARGTPRGERRARATELLQSVQLPASFAGRLPSELSGGQRQRVAIARAVALEPSLVICDEALSSLDVTTQKEILENLQRLKDQLGMACLFISHDLAVVRRIADRVAVMYLGKVVEQGPAELVFKQPAHPYTQALLSAAPVPDPSLRHRRERLVLKGELPDPTSPPAGCPFHPRCPKAFDLCREVVPRVVSPSPGVTVACHLHEPELVATRAQAGAQGMGDAPFTKEG